MKKNLSVGQSCEHNAIVPDGFATWDEDGITYMMDVIKDSKSIIVFAFLDGCWRKSYNYNHEDVLDVIEFARMHKIAKFDSQLAKRRYSIAEIVDRGRPNGGDAVRFPNNNEAYILKKISYDVEK